MPHCRTNRRPAGLLALLLAVLLLPASPVRPAAAATSPTAGPAPPAAAPLAGAGSSPPVRILVDAQNLQLDALPVNVNGRLMVPMRPIFEALGLRVEYDANTRTVFGSRGYTGIVMRPDVAVALVNGQPMNLDATPFIAQGRLMVPVRFVAESLGAGVQWDGGTRTLTITSATPGPRTPGYGVPGYGQLPFLKSQSLFDPLDPLPMPGLAARTLSAIACPRLEDLFRYLHQYTPTWEQLECHFTDLKRLPIPAFAVSSTLLDPETDSQYVPNPPWTGERFVEHFKYQAGLLDKLATDYPTNVVPLWINGLPPYVDEKYQLITAPFTPAQHDVKIRGAMVPLLLEKKRGRLPVSVTMTYSPGTPWPQFKSAAEVRQWTRDYFLPTVEREAQILEKAKVEYYSPFPNEVEVWFANGMQPTLNQALTPPELLAVAQEFMDTVRIAVRKHFSGRLFAGSYANYESHGQFWDEVNFAGFDEIRFTLTPACDLATARAYHQRQLNGYKRVIERSKVPWGIGELDLYPSRFRLCQTDLKLIAPDLLRELFQALDGIEPPMTSLNVPMLFQPPEVDEILRAYIQASTAALPWRS